MGADRVDVGVLGVGTMGYHHARIYRELLDASLVGVADVDDARAREVAREYDTRAMGREALLEAADAVSIAVPTQFHHELASEAIDRGVHVLVEKPFVEDLAAGEELVERARANDLVLQVGHIERFNPAVEVLRDVLAEHELITVDARRLGPPPEREITDSSVMDLMIHDIDILLSLVDGDVVSVSAMRAKDDPCVSAMVRFADGVTGTLSASRVTQKKVRKLSVTTEECQINVDYISQSMQIHRRSVPEYVVSDGDVRYRHESIIERPTVSNGEPLKEELRGFITAVRTGTEPEVTGEDGLRAIELAKTIERQAGDRAATGELLTNR